jgi:hypothetical protein
VIRAVFDRRLIAGPYSYLPQLLNTIVVAAKINVM